ncbi:MAG: hypothetical protein H0U73_00585 [Tatlockia sp.]|nr:hypothetical protein [Tatlockia sp.]
MVTAPAREDAFLIVLVENDSRQRNKMTKFLMECFPSCEVKPITHGIEAMNFLLTPVNKYHLVILDGSLETYPKTFITAVNGPDIAKAMKEKNIDVPVVLWTNDPNMLARFDEVYEGKRLPEIEKPCRRSNIDVILRPIIEALSNPPKQNIVIEDNSYPQGSAP